MKDVKHYVAVVTASTIWGLFAFVLRPLSRWSPQEILYNRVFLSATLMILMGLLFRRHVWAADRRVIRALPAADRRGAVLQALGGGFLLTGNWFFYIYVLNTVSIKAASMAYLVCPILTTVLAYLLGREVLTRRQWGAVWLSTAGCLVLAFGHLADLVYSMVIAIFYAFYLVTQRKNYGTDKVNLLTVQVVFSAVLLLPFYGLYRGPAPTAPIFYTLIAVIAIFYTIIPLLLSLYGLERLSSSTVGIILYINPLMGFVIAVAFYGERIDWRQGLAYGIVVASILLFNWGSPVLKGAFAEERAGH
ncbi:MAG TPA: EamA family transporter [Puia sp.]|jgi:chloramphenicol-sensitive protein RarD|nr:EamA family transporter [Puia sp.]